MEKIAVVKGKKSSVNIERDASHYAEFTTAVYDEAPNVLCLEFRGKLGRENINNNIEILLADIPYLVDLLKEYY